ncbi:MAG: Mth938-like domain-containing protein [Pseudomonadota bacterium]
MQLTKNDPGDKFLISGYSDTGFRVAGKVQDGAVLVSSVYAEPAPIDVFEAIDDSAADTIAALLGPLDVLLIGTGKSMKVLPSAVRAAFERCGVPVDVMDTGAAARTYNVLVMEDRRAACLLFPSGA